MRSVGIFFLGLGLAASGLGCYLCQHTAGVCDCDPPPVHYVLLPPPRPAPVGGMHYPVSTAHILPPAPGPGVPVGNAPPSTGILLPPISMPGPVPSIETVPLVPRTGDPR